MNKHAHLVGQEISLRTVFNCKYDERDGVCAKCFGDLAYSLHPSDNLGHICTIEFQSGQSQTILSFKHHTGSSVLFGIHIDDSTKEIFTITKNQRHIKFNNGTNLKGLKIQIPRSSIRGFTLVRRTDDWSQVSPSRISSVVDILVIEENGDKWGTAVADSINPCTSLWKHFNI